MIQRRLDFWLVSNGMQEDIDNVDVIPSLKSDHSSIVLSVNEIEISSRGPSFWKLNSINGTMNSKKLQIRGFSGI